MRRNGKGKRNDTAKGMKKTKPMPPATVDVLLGRKENPVRSVEEMNKKMDEDARLSGRIRRTIMNPASRKTCPTAGSVSREGDINVNSSPHAQAHMFSNSPDVHENSLPSGKKNTVYLCFEHIVRERILHIVSLLVEYLEDVSCVCYEIELLQYGHLLSENSVCGRIFMWRVKISKITVDNTVVLVPRETNEIVRHSVLSDGH